MSGIILSCASPTNIINTVQTVNWTTEDNESPALFSYNGANGRVSVLQDMWVDFCYWHCIDPAYSSSTNDYIFDIRSSVSFPYRRMLYYNHGSNEYHSSSGAGYLPNGGYIEGDQYYFSGIATTRILPSRNGFAVFPTDSIRGMSIIPAVAAAYTTGDPVWDTPIFDPLVTWNGVDPTKVTVPAGVGSVKVDVSLDSSTSFGGSSAMYLKINGTIVSGGILGRSATTFPVTMGAHRVSAGQQLNISFTGGTFTLVPARTKLMLTWYD